MKKKRKKQKKKTNKNQKQTNKTKTKNERIFCLSKNQQLPSSVLDDVSMNSYTSHISSKNVSPGEIKFSSLERGINIANLSYNFVPILKINFL